MELHEFAAALAETATLLRSLKKLIPARVDQQLLDYLDRIQDDPAGLELLRNALGLKS